MKPIFKKREVIIEKEEEGVKLGGSSKHKTAIVRYVGKQTENYSIGDRILYDPAVARTEIDFFDKKLLRIEHEDYILCQIVE